MTVPGRSVPSGTPSLLRSLPGRLFLLCSVLLVVLFLVRQTVEVPEFFELFRRVVRIAWFAALGWLAVRLVAQQSGRLLWRVREKLILSYVFLGFVPVLLVVSLALAGGLVLYINVAAYMFHEGFDDISDDVQQLAETAAVEIGRAPVSTREVLNRRYLMWAARYPMLSLAVLPMVPGDAAEAVASAGAWRHGPPPVVVPVWLRQAPEGFRGVIATGGANGQDWQVVIRSAVPTADLSQVVVVDLPVDPGVVADIEARTRTRMGPVFVPEVCGGGDAGQAGGGDMLAFFRQTVAFLDCREWATGRAGRLSISLDAPIGRLYAHVVSKSPQGGGAAGPDVFLGILIALGVFFLVIQGAALFFGALLARSITHAVHELFVGTERVQQGDFTYRIRIDSDDQLGALAASFNRSSASIEHLLHVQREKQRLDDELRIAREIQKSLLPTSPPSMAGIEVADLCEPAREVGGDYYDFFELGPRQLGVMIADVSGKGTSAALYMAELKGLMLSLSGRERSPRRLMAEANRLLAAHLDNRSFITMTYVVIDLDARTLTCARAGHTPLLVVSGGRADLIVPNGMVLGLRLPGATERFAAVLEEYTRPIATGDVFVLFTDGITEATSPDGELFSDDGLARVVASHHRLDAAAIRERVVREVRAFAGDGEPHDDMTMVVIKIGALEPAA